MGPARPLGLRPNARAGRGRNLCRLLRGAEKGLRLPAYRYFTPAADQINPRFAHHDAWLAEITAALTEHPPAFAIVDRTFLNEPALPPVAAFADRSILARLVAHLGSGYEIAYETGRLFVYRKAS